MSDNQKQRRVVVGVDGSPGSRRALRWACDYVDATGGVLDAVSVCTQKAPSGPAPAGNTATHLPGSDVHPPQAVAPLPGMTAMATHMLKKQIAEQGVPEVPDFLDQIVAAGGELWACRMSADMNDVTEADLRDDVLGIISAADFIEKSAGAQLLFI